MVSAQLGVGQVSEMTRSGRAGQKSGSTRGVRGRGLLALLAALGLVLVVGACGTDAQTLRPYTPAEGVNVDVGDPSQVKSVVHVRNLLVIRQWMITEGPGVVLLEVLGQLYWRLGELNSKQFEKFKATLQQQQPYLSLIQDTAAVTLILQRLQHIQRMKAEACQDFLCELSDLTGMKGKRSLHTTG